MPPNRRPSRFALLGALAALAWGCSRCHSVPAGPGVAQPSDLVPLKVDSVLVVPALPRLGTALRQLSQLRLAGLIAALAGEGDTATALADLRSQLGFDLTAPQSLDALGVSPTGSLLTASLPGGILLVVVEVSDPSRFDAAVGKFAKGRLRATARVADNEVVRFTSPTDVNAVVAFGRSGKYAVVSTGLQAVATVHAALSQAPAQSLSSDPGFARQAVAASTLSVYVPPTSIMAPEAGLGQGLSAVLQVMPHEILVTAEAPLSPAQATNLVMPAGAGADLIPALDADAVVLARLGADPGPLWTLVSPIVPSDLRQMLLNAGLKAEEILANLKPGVAVSLSLPGQLDLSRLPSLDPRLTNPFRYVYLAGLGRAKDPAAALATLETTRKFGKQLGADLQTSKQGNDPVYTFKYDLGEGASIALDADEVVVSGGDGRLPPLLSRLHATDGGSVLPRAEAARFAQSGSAVYLDLDRLAARVRAFPSSAYGLGGFAIRAALMRWVDAVNDLHHLALTADVQEGRLHADLRVGLP